MQDDRITERMYKWKPIASRSSGNKKNRWEDDVMKDIKRLKIKNWIRGVQNTVGHNGRALLRRPKHLRNKAVVPD
ncbi:hypothetical protein C0J52_15876 [Blattella germanica]|nr:hypothetical protein C0J52_15876 [Blattella germanica]PSN36956.1 hypothetical protein C0J52_15876 [Blattella germanica]PSN36957.1 hypothetical protein C0J52_15876 [Blattella germanica]PSN36958.1 hypothetical protein C0J52_15876 [Blattella germanica]